MELLPSAGPRREEAIVTVIDIRDFSSLSRNPRVYPKDLVNVLKHFYRSLWEKYFVYADWLKPTGDGMILVFRTPERKMDLPELVERVVKSCLELCNDYPTMFDEETYFFQVPNRLGIGMARGRITAIVHDGEELDYSGHLLICATRLCERARPHGIILDAVSTENLIPKYFRPLFAEGELFIPSVAEKDALRVLYLKDSIDLDSRP
jgi:class 3 adenylate cyclase